MAGGVWSHHLTLAQLAKGGQVSHPGGMDEPDEVSRLAKRIRSLDGSIQWLSIFVLWIGVCSTAAVGLAVYALFFRH